MADENVQISVAEDVKTIITRMKAIEDELRGLKAVPEKKSETAPESNVTVSIKFGDVVVTVEGKNSERAKEDTIALFGMLEAKYKENWERKTQTETARYG